MTDIRIVCTHDAVTLAETLKRLLGAEQHQVRVLAGRQSLTELEATKAAHAAVLLIWSANAPSQHYMREWARHIPPARLIEIARAPGWPPGERKAPPIDFIAWRGDRGARAWSSLKERLRIIGRVLDPPKNAPKRRAVAALGLASIAAVSGAAMMRTQEAPPPAPVTAPDPPEQIASTIPEPAVGIGGPLDGAQEPPSVEEMDDVPALQLAPVGAMPAPSPIDIPEYLAPQLRPPTLFERLSALNPLRDISFLDDDDEEEG